MDNETVRRKALENREKALQALERSGITEEWSSAGCRVNIVGSLRMGLLASHRDIDLHVYSRGVTTAGSFAVMAKIAENPDIIEIKCINGLKTDECCIAWHVLYRDADGDTWQVDIIHIDEGSRYDGYFEHMADRIVQVSTPEQRDTILRLKFETPAGYDWHGVEYYEAVIADGVTSIDQLKDWIDDHRRKRPYYWIP